MNGFELILAAALCLNCTSVSNKSGPNLILLDGDQNGSSSSSSALDKADGGLITSTYITPKMEKNSDSFRVKNSKMQKLRDYVNGRHLRIATIEDYPLSYTVRENGTRIGKGVSFRVIEFLREKYNFSYEVIVPAGNIIGSTEDFADSLVEMLNKSAVDMAAAFVPILSDARRYVFYSSTTLDEGEWIMVMQRPRASASGSGLLAPFEFWVWILIIVSLLAVGPIIYVLIILRNKLTGDTEQQPYSLSHCAWFVYGALMKQGSTLSPIADSTRLLFATWWIFITILTSFYTANLTAFLTLSKFTLPFNTVDDILYKQKQFVTQRGNGVEYAIRGTNESLSKLYGMVQNNHAVFTNLRNDTQTLLTFVEKRGHVFVRDRPAIGHILYADYRYRKTISTNNEKMHCPFAVAKQPFLRKKRAFAYPRNSNLSLLFDPELLNLVESGIIKHLSSRNLPSAEICPQDLGSTERQLENGDLLMTYFIMLSGFATAFAVFTTEILFRFLNQRCQNGHGKKQGVDLLSNGLLMSSRWAYKSDWNNDYHQNKSKKTNISSNNKNITPPPTYQSIFSYKKAGAFLAKNAAGGPAVVGNGRDNGGRVGGLDMDPYYMRFNARYTPIASDRMGVRRTINGRDYFVYRTPNGQSQLVPVRVPSAALFQYTYTE